MHGSPTSINDVFDHPDYLLSKRLGAGGQAEVFLAHHRTLGRKVAIKLLREDQGESMARRMIQEGQLIAKLRHPNLVQVFDAGQTQDGRPYIVMEYIDGLPLGRWLDQEQLSSEEVVELVWQIASGLGAAHEAGIIHRDVKPANILVEDRPDGSGARFCAKLLDFGVARPHDSSETHVGMVIGTIGFMAPEMYDGQPSAASDIFSLGVIFHGLLSGMRGVRASEIRHRLHTVRSEGGETWRRHPDLVELVLAMVADGAAHRPRDAGVLLRRLEQLRPWSRFDETGVTLVAMTATPPRRTSVRALIAGMVGATMSIGLAAAGLFVFSQQIDNRPALTPIPPVAQTASPAATQVETQTAAAPPAAATPPSPNPPSPSSAPPAAQPAGEPPVATGSAEPPDTPPEPPPETSPDRAPSGSSEPPAEAPPSTQSASPAPADAPAPESTEPPKALPVGTYPGTIQGRPLQVELAGTPGALRAVLSLQVGARTEVHQMTGTATLKGDIWHLTAAETGGKWSLRGTLGRDGDRLQASVAIKGKERGRFDARRTP